MSTQPPQMGAGSAWPPPDAPTVFVPDLPSPAYVLSRVRASAVLVLVFLPVLFLATYLRLFRNGLPISRLFNPGVIVAVVVATGALAAVLWPRVGRPTVVAGADWVAGRGVFAKRWRRVPLAQADRYSSRVVRTRSRSNTVLSIAGPAGERVSLTVAPGFSLPAVYLEIGPLKLLPRPIAGAFSWSGCRAALAAETDHPTSSASFVTNPLPAGGVDWRFLGEQRLDAAEYARHTGNPTDRLAHLRRDGLLAVDQAYLAGRHGPRPTEVRMFHGKGALARWVAGSSIDEVTQTSSRPFATRAEVYAVAGSLGG